MARQKKAVVTEGAEAVAVSTVDIYDAIERLQKDVRSPDIEKVWYDPMGLRSALEPILERYGVVQYWVPEVSDCSQMITSVLHHKASHTEIRGSVLLGVMGFKCEPMLCMFGVPPNPSMLAEMDAWQKITPVLEPLLKKELLPVEPEMPKPVAEKQTEEESPAPIVMVSEPIKLSFKPFDLDKILAVFKGTVDLEQLDIAIEAAQDTDAWYDVSSREEIITAIRTRYAVFMTEGMSRNPDFEAKMKKHREKLELEKEFEEVERQMEAQDAQEKRNAEKALNGQSDDVPV